MFNTLRFGDVQQTLDHLRQTMDQFFGYAGSPAWSSDAREKLFSPGVETGWDDDALTIRAIVPGVRQEDLKVSVQQGQLVIEGERKAPTGGREAEFRQLAYGKFSTSVMLPSGVDTDHVQCHLENGILQVT